MTIVSGPDKRNSQWASDKSAFGQRMLLKMGWSEGKGLGKKQQGTNTNLRAIRREDGLGIGAKTDTFGEDGFSSTSKNFHGVLANLHAEHGSDKTSKKDKKKRRKNGDEKDDVSQKSIKTTGSGLTLSKKKVTAGHAKKMRDSKDLSKKSKEDMAAIFGMKVSDYQSNSVWGKLSSLSTSSTSLDDKADKSDENEIKITPDISDSETESQKKNMKEKKKGKKKKRKKEDCETKDSSSNENRKEKKKSRKK